MNRSEQLFLCLLTHSLTGEKPDLKEIPSRDIWLKSVKLAATHSVLPMIIQTAWHEEELRDMSASYLLRAKRLSISQAHRTAEFLLLYDHLSKQGLRPVVMKGITLRALYPHPEQRASVDEDLLISPEEFPRYHQALLDYGLHVAGSVNDHTDFLTVDLADLHELSYEDKERSLYIELHMSLFPSDSIAYGNLSSLFKDVMGNTMTLQIYGQKLRTLSPTDHILYLICHAYKHFLHSGVGIRQIADMAVFINAYGDSIDWDHVYSACRSAHIDVFSAALFRIAHRHLTLKAFPASFAGITVDEAPLLDDILIGGLYGTADINRAHSSNMTLQAVAARRQGNRRHGILHSLFPGKTYLQNHYSYAKSYPILLPIAWGSRIINYLKRNNYPSSNPAETVRIGQARIELLKQYGIIDKK